MVVQSIASGGSHAVSGGGAESGAADVVGDVEATLTLVDREPSPLSLSHPATAIVTAIPAAMRSQSDMRVGRMCHGTGSRQAVEVDVR